MARHRFFSSTILFLLFASATVALSQEQEPAADPLKGKRVVVIHDKAPFLLDDKVVATAADCSVFTVDDVIDGWLWIKSQKAFLKRSDVIPFEEAIPFYTRQIETRPTGDPYWHRAEIWRLKGELDLALNDMAEALRLSPRPNWYNARGLIWHNKQEYDKAIADFSTAIKIDAKNGTAYHNRGRSLRELKEFDKALADFDQAIKLKDPAEKTRVLSDSDLAGADSSQMINSLSLAYFVRGYTHVARGDYEKALADYEEALRRDPSHEKVRIFRRTIWSKLQQWDKILADCKESLARDPKDANALDALARVQATCSDEKLRDGGEAVERATQACELRGWKNADFLDTLAAAYAESGDFDKAVTWEQKAIPLAKANVIADFEARLKLYRNRQPFHEMPAEK